MDNKEENTNIMKCLSPIFGRFYDQVKNSTQLYFDCEIEKHIIWKVSAKEWKIAENQENQTLGGGALPGGPGLQEPGQLVHGRHQRRARLDLRLPVRASFVALHARRLMIPRPMGEQNAGIPT